MTREPASVADTPAATPSASAAPAAGGDQDHPGKRHCRVRIWAPLHFDKRGRFAEQTAKTLDELTELMVRINPDIELRVEGHTDDQLGAARSMRFADRLARKAVDELVRRGVPRERLEPVSRGNELPIRANRDEQARAFNRRVEFMARDDCDQPAPPAPPAPPARPGPRACR